MEVLKALILSGNAILNEYHVLMMRDLIDRPILLNRLKVAWLLQITTGSTSKYSQVCHFLELER